MLDNTFLTNLFKGDESVTKEYLQTLAKHKIDQEKLEILKGKIASMDSNICSEYMELADTMVQNICDNLHEDNKIIVIEDPFYINKDIIGRGALFIGKNVKVTIENMEKEVTECTIKNFCYYGYNSKSRIYTYHVYVKDDKIVGNDIVLFITADLLEDGKAKFLSLTKENILCRKNFENYSEVVIGENVIKLRKSDCTIIRDRVIGTFPEDPNLFLPAEENKHVQEAAIKNVTKLQRIMQRGVKKYYTKEYKKLRQTLKKSRKNFLFKQDVLQKLNIKPKA